MSFKRKFNTLIRKSDNSICEFSNDNGIELYIYDKNKEPICKKRLVTGINGFSNSFFNIDSNDSIYGIVSSKDNPLLYFYISSKFIYKSELLKSSNSIEKITFPYIKKIGDKIHIFYYLVDVTQVDRGKLIHYYYDGSNWNKSQIDNIEYFILSNFVVTFKEDVPTIFYLNSTKGHEEVFISNFNKDNLSWNHPVQVTNTHKTKVYLSVVEVPQNTYHIVFSEKNNDKYYCTYYSGQLKNNSFIKKDYFIIQDTIACEFPHILRIKNELYIQWIEFSELFTTFSKDNGFTWSKPNFFTNDSDNSVIRYDYKSNFIKDKNNDICNIYSYEDIFSILGISSNPILLTN
ncbi:Uncharacterised protein [Clostridium paraputrificum]|uniref:hypothetical protein n=1 Tax=Clostridium paraputrificum TaxID=29363 RepID=UPI0006C2079B|nr:hypothetical protein [Clostridium paraputrificum]CUQ25600.1 Uncharacterised protein [Clostridium paraputrificum]